jgi:hypothetical protein
MDFLKNLAMDIWYKPLIGLGSVILLYSLYAQANTFLLFGSFMFFFGLGEWRSHIMYHAPRNVYWNPFGNLMQVERINSITGIFFYLISFISLALFFVLIAKQVLL